MISIQKAYIQAKKDSKELQKLETLIKGANTGPRLHYYKTSTQHKLESTLQKLELLGTGGTSPIFYPNQKSKGGKRNDFC